MSLVKSKHRVAAPDNPSTDLAPPLRSRSTGGRMNAMTCACCLRRNCLSLNCNCQRPGMCRECLKCSMHCQCDKQRHGCAQPAVQPPGTPGRRPLANRLSGVLRGKAGADARSDAYYGGCRLDRDTYVRAGGPLRGRPATPAAHSRHSARPMQLHNLRFLQVPLRTPESVHGGRFGGGQTAGRS